MWRGRTPLVNIIPGDWENDVLSEQCRGEEPSSFSPHYRWFGRKRKSVARDFVPLGWSAVSALLKYSKYPNEATIRQAEGGREKGVHGGVT